MNSEQVSDNAAPITSKAAKKTAKKTPVKMLGMATKSAKKTAAKSSRAPKSKVKRANKKADVIDLMGRPAGVTLAEIIEATGWQKHTVRGFVSVLGSKGGREDRKLEKRERGAHVSNHKVAPVTIPYGKKLEASVAY